MELLNNLLLGFGVAFTFQNLLYALGGALLGTLIAVLTYHVAKGRIGSKTVAKHSGVTTLQGEKIKVTVSDQGVMPETDHDVLARVVDLVHAEGRVR